MFVYGNSQQEKTFKNVLKELTQFGLFESYNILQLYIFDSAKLNVF